MTIVNTNPAPQKVAPHEQEESLAADLAWEYCKRVRNGESPSIAGFLQQLPDDLSRDEFHLLISMNEFIEHAVDQLPASEARSLAA